MAFGLLGFAGAAQATPLDELTALAAYFPADTLGFATARTDDAYIDQLQALLDGVIAQIPDAEPVTLRSLLNEAVGGDFELRVRTWLGDSVALGLISLDAADYVSPDPMVEIVPPFLAAAQITDRVVVEAFVKEGGAELSTTSISDDYSVYLVDGVALLVAESVVLLGDTEATVTTAFDGFEATLADSADFTAALDALPLDDYNIAGYLNTRALVQLSIDSLAVTIDPNTPEGASALAIVPTLEQSRDALGTAAFGLTILDGRNLVFDLATTLDETAAAAQSALPGFITQSPISLDFAAHIPADAQLVIHDNGFGPELLAAFESFNALGPILQTQVDAAALLLEESGGSTDGMDMLETLDLSAINFGGGLRVAAESLFATATGLNLEADVLNWMTGDYAAYMRFLPLEGDLPFTFDAAVLWQATDPAAAAAVVDGLTAAVEAYGLGFRSEDLADGEALVLEAPIRAIIREAVPPELIGAPEFDFLFASDDEVFVAGSRPSVEFALEPGASLLESPAFVYAADQLLLPDTTTIWFVNVPPLVEALPALEGLVPSSDLADLTTLLRLLESATISAQMADDARTATARLTLTLPAAGQ